MAVAQVVETIVAVICSNNASVIILAESGFWRISFYGRARVGKSKPEGAASYCMYFGPVIILL